jgi:2-polyprenyl-6-methoxyphenol hydroxylase-like FAD-dependent oxidoreductase
VRPCLRVAINGAGIAGATLAYWLRRTGHQVLLIEEAPTLRTGGYVIDFWGLGYDIAERMGLLPRIKEVGYPLRGPLRTGRGVPDHPEGERLDPPREAAVR